MNTGTKFSVTKELNQRVNVLVATLGIRKTHLLDKLTKVPVEDLRDLLRKADNEVRR